MGRRSNYCRGLRQRATFDCRRVLFQKLQRTLQRIFSFPRHFFPSQPKFWTKKVGGWINKLRPPIFLVQTPQFLEDPSNFYESYLYEIPHFFGRTLHNSQLPRSSSSGCVCFRPPKAPRRAPAPQRRRRHSLPCWRTGVVTGVLEDPQKMGLGAGSWYIGSKIQAFLGRFFFDGQSDEPSELRSSAIGKWVITRNLERKSSSASSRWANGVWKFLGYPKIQWFTLC